MANTLDLVVALDTLVNIAETCRQLKDLGSTLGESLTNETTASVRFLDNRSAALAQRKREDSINADDTSSDTRLISSGEGRSTGTTWARVKSLCGRTVPMCMTLQNWIHDDVENLVNVLSDAESISGEVDDADESESLHTALSPQSSISSEESLHVPNSSTESSSSLRPQRTRRRSRSDTSYENPQSPTIIFSNDHCPSLPSIILTPCPDERAETSSRIPLQDSALGAQLIVPGHPAYNHTFPPMVEPACFPSAKVVEWKWVEGHWRAIVPGLAEQDAKGLFSRPTPKRRTRRKSAAICRMDTDFEVPRFSWTLYHSTSRCKDL